MTTPIPLAECSAGHAPRSNVVDITSANGRLLPVPGECVRVSEPKVDANTIAALEMLLSRAKAGEIVALAAVTATSDGKFGTLFEYGGTPSGFALTTGAQVLAARLVRDHS